MNRRSFLSSLAALSLPAVVAGKVADDYVFVPKVACDQLRVRVLGAFSGQRWDGRTVRYHFWDVKNERWVVYQPPRPCTAEPVS